MHRIDIDHDRPDRIGIPWMSIQIRIRIWQDDADPTRSISGSTTVFVPVCWGRWSDAGSRCSVMSSDRCQKSFAIAYWYLVRLIFNLYRLLWWVIVFISHTYRSPFFWFWELERDGVEISVFAHFIFIFKIFMDYMVYNFTVCKIWLTSNH